MRVERDSLAGAELGGLWCCTLALAWRDSAATEPQRRHQPSVAFHAVPATRPPPPHTYTRVGGACTTRRGRWRTLRSWRGSSSTRPTAPSVPCLQRCACRQVGGVRICVSGGQWLWVPRCRLSSPALHHLLINQPSRPPHRRPPPPCPVRQVTEDDLARFHATYRGSEAERADLLRFYAEFEGDMQMVRRCGSVGVVRWCSAVE